MKVISFGKIFGKIKCKLGFHDFQFKGVDDSFMPKVRVLKGQCSRCVEFQNFFLFFDSEKIVVRNHGLERIFGDVVIMPMEKK